jgi:histidine ammonia-lyase
MIWSRLLTAAAMASENKRLAVPASVDSLPTSGMQEDHVSMAWSAARKLRKVIDNVRRILAVEYIIASRAIELRKPHRPAPATEVLLDLLRSRVQGLGPDRYLSPELKEAEELLRGDDLADVLYAASFDIH